MKTPDSFNNSNKQYELSVEDKKRLNEEIAKRGGYITNSMVTDQEAFYDLRAGIYDAQNEMPDRTNRRGVMDNFYHAELFKILQGKNLDYLDFGCATGTSTKGFIEGLTQYASINRGWAIDISKKMVEIAKKTLPDFKVRKGGVGDINFNTELDLITSFFHVLCHLSDEELKLFFKNTFNALKPDGILCFDVIKRFNIGERGYSRENEQQGEKYIVYNSTKKDGTKITDANSQPIIGTVRMFTREELTTFAKDAGFEVVEIREVLIENPNSGVGDLKEYAVILRKR